MGAFTDNVQFSHVAREWRCKWSEDDDKKTLAAAQTALDARLAQVKAVAGVKSVQRVVCGGCQDFKVIINLDAESFGAWEAAEFAPEKEFLAEIEAAGLKRVETQTFTLETL
jgi:hypothetical protein